ncbi:MAG TPA: hypothetical protein VF773_20950 [Verrucomicrobiae bacterium]
MSLRKRATMDGTMVRVACCFGDEGKFAYSGEVLFNHVQPQAAEGD